MSCNGCRVLRKGCSEDCALRPSLEWIKSPQSQANATLFLAKFYGRAGLINLINNAGTTLLRPEIFKSLMYEACGRIINPIHGSVGLICSGEWQRCQAAVDAVLQGSPLITTTTQQVFGDIEESSSGPLIQRCDIRHLPKDSSATLVRTRKRFKRSPADQSDSTLFAPPMSTDQEDSKFTITGWNVCNNNIDNNDDDDDDRKGFYEEFINRAPSQDSLISAETVELALVNEPGRAIKPEPDAIEIRLELTLGLNPVPRPDPKLVIEISDSEA